MFQNVILRLVGLTAVDVETARSITYSKFDSVALVTQQAVRMRRIIMLSVACPDLIYFPSIISQKTRC